MNIKSNMQSECNWRHRVACTRHDKHLVWSVPLLLPSPLTLKIKIFAHMFFSVKARQPDRRRQEKRWRVKEKAKCRVTARMAAANRFQRRSNSLMLILCMTQSFRMHIGQRFFILLQTSIRRSELRTVSAQNKMQNPLSYNSCALYQSTALHPLRMQPAIYVSIYFASWACVRRIKSMMIIKL